ncbi:MAG TPA: hypothetical protein VFZ57_04470 [Thermoanaerobaculia bacterium]|nr:hypothetical protein [Thermoanaerobaculia bacterium]
MELDDLKQRWEEQDAKLNASLRLNTHLLIASGLGKTESALGRLSRLFVAGLVVNFAAALWLGSFLAEHVRETRFLIPGAALHLGAIALLFVGARQLVALKQIDLGEPVVAIQRRLESLRVGRLRAAKWTLLLAPLAWVPLLVVALKGFFGLDAYAIFDRWWFAANALLSVLVLAAALFVSRRYADRMGNSPIARRLMKELAGHNLTAAQSHLDALARFAEEEGRA